MVIHFQKPIIPPDLYRAVRDSQLIGLSGYSREVLTGHNLFSVHFTVVVLESIFLSKCANYAIFKVVKIVITDHTHEIACFYDFCHTQRSQSRLKARSGEFMRGCHV